MATSADTAGSTQLSRRALALVLTAGPLLWIAIVGAIYFHHRHTAAAAPPPADVAVAPAPTFAGAFSTAAERRAYRASYLRCRQIDPHTHYSELLAYLGPYLNGSGGVASAHLRGCGDFIGNSALPGSHLPAGMQPATG